MSDRNYQFFMEADLEQFHDEWIAIIDDQVVAHGKDVKKVFQEAKERYPQKRPLIARMPGHSFCRFTVGQLAAHSMPRASFRPS